MKNWKKVFIIIFIVLIAQTQVYAESSENTISSEQETLGINTFIEESKQYTSDNDFFDGLNVKDIINKAVKGEVDNSSIYKKILNLFGKELKETITSLVAILAIILIHSILRSISESLKNDGVSKIIYYVQYILIVTIIMTNISSIVNLVKETCINLTGFMNLLVPLLITLMTYTGSIATSGLLEPIILFMINFLSNLIQDVIIPVVLIITSLCAISKLSDEVQIEKIVKLMKSGVGWVLGILLTIFVGVISLEGTMSSSVDGITAKTTKAIVSTAIPVVGKVLGDAVDTVLGCGVVLKNAVGLVGIIIILGICIVPIIKLTVITISYKILAGVCQPIADEKIIKLLDQMGDVFKIFLAILCSMSVMIIVGTALVVKMSNSGMMYR